MKRIELLWVELALGKAGEWGSEGEKKQGHGEGGGAAGTREAETDLSKGQQR